MPDNFFSWANGCFGPRRTWDELTAQDRGFGWFLPNSGIWRDVMGIVSDTLSWNTVSERSTVTPKSKRKICGYSCLLAGAKLFYREFARIGRERGLWWFNKQISTTGEYKVLIAPICVGRKLEMSKETFFSSMKREKFCWQFKFKFTFSVHGLHWRQNRIIQNKHGWFFLLLSSVTPPFSPLFPPVFLFFSLLGVSLPCGTIAGRAFLARVYLIIPHSTLMCHIS